MALTDVMERGKPGQGMLRINVVSLEKIISVYV